MTYRYYFIHVGMTRTDSKPKIKSKKKFAKFQGSRVDAQLFYCI